MLSLRVFDRTRRDELMEAYRRATLLILDAIAHRGRAGDESDYQKFRTSIAGVTARLSAPECLAADVLVGAGAATMAIQEHNRHEVASARARATELQAVVKMLTQTMTAVSSGSERSLSRLQDIERRLAKSQEIFDLRDLRQQMAECLVSVREEAACRKKESERLVSELHAAVRQKEPREGAAPVDPSTVPASNASVQDFIKRAVLEGKPVFVAMLAIDHLKMIAARFGQAAADRVAAFCGEQLKLHFTDVKAVGVWNGSTCVVLADGAGGLEAVERAVHTESLRRQPLTLDLGQREVMVQVSYSKWGVIPVEGRSASSVLEDLNGFNTQATAAAE